MVLLTAIVSGCNEGRGSGEPQLQQAWSLLRVGERKSADKTFEEVFTSSSSTVDRAWALYGRAMTRINEADEKSLTEADQFLDQALKVDPDGETAPWVLLAKARQQSLRLEMARDQLISEPKNQIAAEQVATLREGAELQYSQVISTFPDHPAGDEAASFFVTSLIDRNDPAFATRAISTIDEFAKRRNNSKWLVVMYSLRARADRVLNDAEGRLASEMFVLETIKRLDPSAIPDLSHSYFTIATTAEFQVGDFTTARTYYQKFIDEYPKEQRVFTAKQALVRMDKFEAQLLAGEVSPVATPVSSGASTMPNATTTTEPTR